MTSPLSPLPATDRSSVSVVLLVDGVVLTIVEPFFQTYVNVIASPSASLGVTVAVSVWLVVGAVGVRSTVAVGAAFVSVRVAVAVLLGASPSLAR